MEMTKERIETMRVFLRLGRIISLNLSTSLESQIIEDGHLVINQLLESNRITDLEVKVLLNYLVDLEKIIKRKEG